MCLAKQDECLKLTCPHCQHEHSIIGVNIDRLRSCHCPLCGAFCDIYTMNYAELCVWLLLNYVTEGERYD